MKRFVVFTYNLSSEEVVLKESFENLEDADKYFVEGTAFNSIANWVESIGHYGCNSSNFDYYVNPELDVILDVDYEFLEDEIESYDAQQYIRFKKALLPKSEKN